MQSRVWTAWLVRSPQRYPWIPQRGIPQNTNPSLTSRLAMLKRKVSPVFPSPLRILFKVLAMYIKGHKKLKMIIKSPERLFW